MSSNSIQQKLNKAGKVTVIVATHKEYRMPKDDMYVPMFVGAAVETVDPVLQETGYLRDNVGENISARNPYFCELTGLYWAWKHTESEYLGLVHYRRHFRGDGTVRSGIRGDIFDQVIRYDELLPMLGKCPVIVPKKRHYYIETIWSHYAHTHYAEHLEKTREIIKTRYPGYLESFDEVMNQRSAHMFNMMVMRRDLMSAYCTWLFDILFELEKQIDCSGYSYFQGRYCGRVGELILNVWLRQQVKEGTVSESEIMELPYVYIEHQNWLAKGSRFLRAKFLHQRYE